MTFRRSTGALTVVLAMVAPSATALVAPAGARPHGPHTTVTSWAARHATPLASTEADPRSTPRPAATIARRRPIVALGESAHGAERSSVILRCRVPVIVGGSRAHERRGCHRSTPRR